MRKLHHLAAYMVKTSTNDKTNSKPSSGATTCRQPSRDDVAYPNSISALFVLIASLVQERTSAVAMM